MLLAAHERALEPSLAPVGDMPVAAGRHLQKLEKAQAATFCIMKMSTEHIMIMIV